MILSPLSPEECYHIFHLIVRKALPRSSYSDLIEIFIVEDQVSIKEKKLLLTNGETVAGAYLHLKSDLDLEHQYQL